MESYSYGWFFYIDMNAQEFRFEISLLSEIFLNITLFVPYIKAQVP